MDLITVRDLVKTYRVAVRRPGALGALAGLVRREYRTVQALDGISFDIAEGELVGYIGPNGAGKSTTIKVLSGILVPDSGECTVAGRVPWLQRVPHVRTIGVVFGQRTQLWWDLPVIESFDLLRDIYRVPQPDYRSRRDRLVDMLDLAPLLDVPVRQLSLGQRMRCDLAAALLHGPRLLFLDEPTIGLDAVSKLAVREFVMELNQTEGVTIILTTHDLDDIETLCSRVLLINNGKVLFSGPLSQLRAQVTSERWLIVSLMDADQAIVDPDATEIRRDDHRVYLRFYPERVSAAELIARIAARHQVRDLYVENPPIDEVIAQLYRESPT